MSGISRRFTRIDADWVQRRVVPERRDAFSRSQAPAWEYACTGSSCFFYIVPTELILFLCLFSTNILFLTEHYRFGCGLASLVAKRTILD
jgi:hypothetical protein